MFALVQFYKWFTDLELAMKSEVSIDCLLQHVWLLSVCRYVFVVPHCYFLSIDRGEVSALCQHFNGAHTNM